MPEGRLEVNITGRGFIVTLKSFVAVVPEESVAATVKVKTPLSLGTPVTEQVAFTVIPLGRVPEVFAQVYGAVPPETVIY